MKKISKNKTLKPNVVLFYICYTAFIVSTMFKRVLVFGEVASNIYQICLVLLALTCIISIAKMPKKKMMLLYLITILVVITRFTTSNNIMLSLWLLVVAARNIKLEDIIKYDLVIKIPALIIMPCLYFADLTYTNIHFRDGEMRHSMGFSNPNVFSTYIMSVLIEILYLRRSRLGVVDVLMAVAAIFLIDYYADSRTQVICIVVLMAILFFEQFAKKRFRPKKKSVFRLISTFLVDHAFTVMLILSLCLVGLYSASSSSDLKDSLKELSHNRVNYASEMMDEYDIPFLGQEVVLVYRDRAEITGEKIQSLDNAYIYTLLMYGIVVTLVYAFFMKKYMQKARVDGNIIRFIMLIYLLGGLMEHFCMEPQLNIFLLYFSYVLYDDGKKVIQERSNMEKNDG